MTSENSPKKGLSKLFFFLIGVTAGAVVTAIAKSNSEKSQARKIDNSVVAEISDPATPMPDPIAQPVMKTSTPVETPAPAENTDATIELTPHWNLGKKGYVNFNMSAGGHKFKGIKNLKKPGAISKKVGDYEFKIYGAEVNKLGNNLFSALIFKGDSEAPIKALIGDLDKQEIREQAYPQEWRTPPKLH